MQKKNEYIKDIEHIISQVQGVISGRIICQDNDIVEIHVLSDTSRSPKQVVRDIESAVLIKLGLELDHKKISVAQLGNNNLPVSVPEFRLKFSSINFSKKNGTVTTSITVDAGNNSYTATVTGPSTKYTRLRLASSATLSAIEQSKNIKGALMVGDVQKINLCDHEVVAVAVFYQSNKTEEILLGTALNKGDDLESTVRATFDALNRKVSSLK